MSKRDGMSRKRRLKAIRSLERRIAAHERKIRERPEAPYVSHWRIEIAAFEEQIRRQRERLGRA
jgi:hypothetical protein